MQVIKVYELKSIILKTHCLHLKVHFYEIINGFPTFLLCFLVYVSIQPGQGVLFYYLSEGDHSNFDLLGCSVHIDPILDVCPLRLAQINCNI